jgi:hypothetical protein
MRLKIDALDLALRASITQEQDRQWHRIAYYLRKFTAPKEQYNVHNKELIVIVNLL